MIQLPLERHEALLVRALLEKTNNGLRAHPNWADIPVADELKNVLERLEGLMLKHDNETEMLRRQANVGSALESSPTGGSSLRA